jgi:hypothetical protein
VKDMTPAIYNRFIKFLKEELALSSESIQTVQKTAQQNLGPLPMILWQYGLVTLEELDRIYDWLETDYII